MVLAVILAIVLIAAALVGWHKGAIRQIGSISAVVIALIVCRLWGDRVVPLMGGWLGVDDPTQGSWSDYSAVILAYAALFMLVWLLVWLLARMLHQAIRIARLGIIDKASGAAFLMGKWALVGSIVLNLLKVVEPQGAVFAVGGWQGSLVDALLAFAPWLWGAIGINL